MSNQVNTNNGTSFIEIKAAYVNSGQTEGSTSLNRFINQIRMYPPILKWIIISIG